MKEGQQGRKASRMAGLQARVRSDSAAGRLKVQEKDRVRQLEELNGKLERLVNERSEALFSSDQMLRIAKDLAGIGLYDYDVGTGTILWDERIREFWGVDPDMPLTSELFNAGIHPDDRSYVLNTLIQLFTWPNNGRDRVEYRVINLKTGIERWLSSSRYVFFEDGRPVRLVGAVQDITESKRAEEILRRHYDRLEEIVAERTMELEERNKKLGEEILERRKAEEEKKKIVSQLAQSQRIEALDRFAGGIAHDLNNILYPIIINTEMLIAEAPLDSTLHDVLNQILKAAYRQKELVKKILSFTRQSETEFRPMKIVPLVEETLDFLRSSLTSMVEIRLAVDADDDLVLGDSTQIGQVIMNLCQNAADALENRRGVIDVCVENVYMEHFLDFQDAVTGNYLRISVKDTGQGMTHDVIERIYEPFFTTKAVGKGTGMGLSVVHGILKSHGGAITAESEPGKGSLFTVYLPLYEGKPDERPPSCETGPDPRTRGKILLVDDEEIILASMQRMLKMSGYRVIALKDGEEALRLFGLTPDEFDLVITDLTMPKLTGIELAGKLRSIRPEIPIILCTGFNDAINAQDARSQGIRELLLKPMSSREVLRTIEKVLER